MRFPWGHPPPKESEARRQEILHLLSKRLKECDEALRENPEDVDALFTKSVFLARIGEFWPSHDCLAKVTELEPEYPGVWHFTSSMWQRVGDHKKAEMCLRRAFAQSPIDVTT